MVAGDEAAGGEKERIQRFVLRGRDSVIESEPFVSRLSATRQ